MDKETVEYVIKTITTIDYSVVVLLGMIIIMAGMLWNLNKSPKSKFFFDDLLTGTDGKTSTTKLALVIALILSSWEFINLSIKSQMTEWYFMGYMGIWVLNKGYKNYMEMKTDTKI